MQRIHRYSIGGTIIIAMMIILFYGSSSSANTNSVIPTNTNPGIIFPSETGVPLPSTTTLSTPDEPVILDSDGDGLNDNIELQLGSDPSNPDTDYDTVSDKDEVYTGANPLIFGEDRESVERRVEVDLTSQQLHYFMNNVELGTMPVSTGLPSKPTPVGTFFAGRKLPIARYISRIPGDEYDLPNVKWNIEFKSKYFLHTAYWHNQFGIRAMSHGCVNMREADAKIMYYFLQKGDKVTIYGKTPVGKVKK